ncbi:hypothetical protein B0H16DRAFT_1730354 [Mycena metata]|uniref:Uncharacterized protein n=1 Tax=Mycena metata TaxID=1033252 RepID=A0AAD7MY35_9AGAR|nr:hypothetical protein B0H16DRAFT_1730354 [Mycena metata]
MRVDIGKRLRHYKYTKKEVEQMISSPERCTSTLAPIPLSSWDIILVERAKRAAAKKEDGKFAIENELHPPLKTPPSPTRPRRASWTWRSSPGSGILTKNPGNALSLAWMQAFDTFVKTLKILCPAPTLAGPNSHSYAVEIKPRGDFFKVLDDCEELFEITAPSLRLPPDTRPARLRPPRPTQRPRQRPEFLLGSGRHSFRRNDLDRERSPAARALVCLICGQGHVVRDHLKDRTEPQDRKEFFATHSMTGVP